MAFYRATSSMGGGSNGLFGTLFPSVSGTFSTYVMANMFDDDDTTFWIGYGQTSYVYLENMPNQNVAKIKLRPSNYDNSNYTMNIVISGSNTSTSSGLVQIASLSCKYSDGLQEVSVNSSYKYFVITVSNTVAGYYGGLARLQAE